MTFPVRFPDGRTFGPYSVEELKQYSAEGKFPPNTEVEAGGEWVSLGGWLVVRKRVEELQATQASVPLNPAPQAEAPVTPGRPPIAAIAIGALLFLAVVATALYLR